MWCIFYLLYQRTTGGGTCTTPWRDPIGWVIKTLSTTCAGTLFHPILVRARVYSFPPLSAALSIFLFLYLLLICSCSTSFLPFSFSFSFAPHYLSHTLFLSLISTSQRGAQSCARAWILRSPLLPHGGWKDLPKSVRWTEFGLRKRRTGKFFLFVFRHFFIFFFASYVFHDIISLT